MLLPSCSPPSVCGGDGAQSFPVAGELALGLGVSGTNWSRLLLAFSLYPFLMAEQESYHRRFRLAISHVIPSTEQFAQGLPDSVTVHLTFRELQALHATMARFSVRVGGSGEEALSICDILPTFLLSPCRDGCEYH